MSDLISRSQLLKEIESWGGCVDALHDYIQNMPTAYDVDKVVDELEKTMQDLSVIEVFSHIDFDSTIQSSLDEFLKAYNSELLRIIKQGGVFNDVCEWKYHIAPSKDVYFLTDCGHRHNGLLSNNRPYCGFCGKKIKVVK